NSFANWIRAGNNSDTSSLCDFDDVKGDTVGQYYEDLLSRYSTTVGTWAPYALASDENRSECGFGVAFPGNNANLSDLPSIDVVITSDMSKWTRCIVFEMNDAAALAEGNTLKGNPRSHASWNKEWDENGRPVYSTIPGDT